MIEIPQLSDTLQVALTRGRGLADEAGVKGFGVVQLFDERGKLKHLEEFTNLLTTAGDQYYATKVVVGVSPAGITAPTVASGMKLGTSSTAVTKSSTAAALIGYISGSQKAFDASFPAVAAVGGDAGWNATYQTTWPAGTVTNSNINEVAIVNDAATNATSTAANTYARAVISLVNKGVGDSLVITWSHKILGA